ncbi:MAG: hypothetical protein PHZ09_13935 [Eubacteriales bacterium]|nr:hypothetical protein [Eubacteriales bacterium]
MTIKNNSIKNKIVKKLIKIASVILIAAAPALPLSADEQPVPTVSVMPDMSFSLLSGKIDIIDSLDTVSSRWLPMENTASIEAAASFSNYPFEPLEGRRCLTALSDDADASVWRYINYEPASPLDLSAYNTFFYAVNVPRLSGGRTRTALMLYSADGAVFTVSADLTTETWNGVIADISDFEERFEISRVRIGVQHNYGRQANYPYSFQIDCLAASPDRYLARSLRFMSGSYLVYGGESTLSYDYNPMRMTVSVASILAAECFIEARLPSSDSFAAANSIRLRLANESSCTSVTMEYATPDSPVYAGNKPVTVNLVTGRDIAAYYFPIPDGPVTQIKFSFNGAAEGDIHIYSITPAEFYSPLPPGYSVLSDHGSLTTCRLTDDGKKILIAGTMTEAGVALYKNHVIELYELKPWQSNAYIFDGEASPVMSAAVASQFSFEINAADNINSRFVAAVNG